RRRHTSCLSDWSSDVCSSDLVYFNMDRSTATRPYTPPEAVLDIFRRELDGAYAESGLYVLTMHPHHSGHHSRIWILDEIIRHAKIGRASCRERGPTPAAARAE